jgi:hypothetical protein
MAEWYVSQLRNTAAKDCAIRFLDIARSVVDVAYNRPQDNDAIDSAIQEALRVWVEVRDQIK